MYEEEAEGGEGGYGYRLNAFIEFIQLIAEQFQLWTTLDPDEAGVRIRWGRKVKPLANGIHYMLPFIDSIRAINIRPQVVDLPDQSLDTEDKVSVVVSGSVEYNVCDAKIALLDIQDFDESLVTFINGIIASVIAETRYDDCKLYLLQEAIFDQLAEESDNWGIEVTAVYITSFTKNRVIRLLN